MRILKSLILILTILITGGCALMQSFSPSSAEQVDALIERQQYARALAAIDNVPPTDKRHAAFMKKKEQIQQLSQALVDDTLKKTEDHVNQGQWQQALELYNDSLKKIPDNKILIRAREAFIKRREAHAEQLAFQLYLYQGEWVKNSARTMEQLEKVQPVDLWQKLRRWDFNNKKSEVLNNLAKCTEQSIQAGNYQLARRCLNMVNEIDHQKQLDKKIAHSSRLLEKKDKKQRQQRINKCNALIDELKQGYTHENLLRVNQQLLLFESDNSLSAEETSVHTLLQQHLDNGIKQSMEAGRRIYSEGKIKEALEIWTNLQAISPENEELASHINRAKRVLDKLKDLNTENNDTVDVPKE